LSGDPENFPFVEQQLRKIIHDFRTSDARAGAEGAMEWLAVTLEHALDSPIPSCSDRPRVGRDWFSAVEEAAGSLDESAIPERLCPATKSLFRHVLLQNGELERRKAIDTLVAGGWQEAISSALEKVLKDVRGESWIRVRALFSLGFLQRRDRAVANMLSTSLNEIYSGITKSDNSMQPSQISEMHAVLFAIGDCFGADLDLQGGRTRVRNKIEPILREVIFNGLVDQPENAALARAVAYALTFIAQDRRHADSPDFTEELLDHLKCHCTDGVTRRFSDWVLGFRFSETGKVRSLLSSLDRS
jgi:hypothetical protein